MLLREVDGELVEDLTGVSSKGSEELIPDNRKSVGWAHCHESRKQRALTVPDPSMMMKPNLVSVSRSSESAAVWNLLSQR
jgi:hypothetical protein